MMKAKMTIMKMTTKMNANDEDNEHDDDMDENNKDKNNDYHANQWQPTMITNDNDDDG